MFVLTTTWHIPMYVVTFAPTLLGTAFHLHDFIAGRVRSSTLFSSTNDV